MALKQSFASALTETWAAADDPKKDQLGDHREDENGRYKLVKYHVGTGTISVAVGDVVYYKDYSAHEVTGDQSDTEGCAAGVALAAASATGTRLWVQTRGEYSPLNTDVTAGAAGNAMTHVGADDKTLDVSAAVTDPIVGTLIDATTGAQKLLCNFPD